MQCGSCGAPLLPGKQFCHACGAPAERQCGNCGVVLKDGFRFCPDCGAPVEQPGGGVAETPTPAIERFADNMPAAMAEKILASRSTIAGERKVVTVLFCDLADSTAVASRLDPEEYRELLDRYLELAIREIYRFEGIVNQLAGDGLMALFGAPIAHEDDPARAVWAALAVRDRMREFNRQLHTERGIELPARIGINTGPVVVGAVGNDLKMDYTAIGDTTNLAARLESLATPGSVLVSESTARLVRGFFRMLNVGPISVKGKAEQISAYEMLEPIETTSPMAVAAARGLTPLVGREEELAQLQACFDRLSGSLPQVVCVIGDTGGGKSRLIHEFRERLEGSATTVLETRCSALHQLEPYYPFVRMLHRYFEIDPKEPESVTEERVASKAGISVAKISEEFPHLCRLLSQTVYEAADIPNEELQRETMRAVGNVVVREARNGPLVLLVEDLHWIDEQSREFLELALARLSRLGVMMILSYRADFSFSARTPAVVTTLTLRPLEASAMREMIESLVGGSVPAELEKRILEKAEGSPFFVEEITRSLLEEGQLTCGPEGCRLSGAAADLRIPGSVQEVLAARLDRLRPGAKRVAQLAAVLGRQFERPQLEDLLGGESSIDVRRELAELEERGIVHRSDARSDIEYRFGESLTQEVAYESLLLKERRQLHESVGRMLEGGGGDGQRERPTLVAHHYALSDNRPKAIKTLLRAARDAEQLPAYRTALDLFRQAWELAEMAGGNGSGESKRWLLEAAFGYARIGILYGSSREPFVLEAARVARATAEELGETTQVISTYTFEGMALTADPEHFEAGVELVEKGVELAEKSGASELAISSSRALAWNYMLDGRYQAAEERLAQALERVVELGMDEPPSDLYLGVRMMHQQALFYANDFDASFAETSETEELSKRVSNRTIGVGSAGHLAHIHFIRGEYRAARECAERSLRLAEEIGAAWGTNRSAVLAVAAHVELEGTKPPRHYLELAEEGIRQGGNMLLSILQLVESLVALLQFQRAERVARDALERSAGKLRIMLSNAALGDATLRLGPTSWPESERCFQRSLELAEETGALLVEAVATNGLGKLALVRDQPELAARHFRHTLQVSRENGFGRYAARAERLLMEVAGPEAIQVDQVTGGGS